MSPSREHVFGLDALRFVAAIWVVFSHLGPVPVLTELDGTGPIGFLIHGARGIAHSGAAAVIVFFIISGFCIHYPNAGGAPFRIVPYLVRRYVRIAIPMAAAMLLALAIGMDAIGYFDAILWSLVAELIYYTIYPIVRRLMNRFTIESVIAGSYVASLLVALTNPGATTYGEYGWKLTWLLGLPSWLLGVKLAEVWRSGAIATGSGPETGIWKWRFLVWGLSSACLALNFHSPIGHPWTLNLFSLVAYAWLVREIHQANRTRRPWPFLEWAGQWSYSIYLCHMLADRIFASLGVPAYAGRLGDWGMRMIFILAFSYGFYLAIERPGHVLARRVSHGLAEFRA